MEKPAERITLIEEWQGNTLTTYILKPGGRREMLDTETITPRPFIKVDWKDLTHLYVD